MFEKVTVKTDFVTELARVLSKGREVRIRAVKRRAFSSAVDIEIIVQSPPLHASGLITAEEVFQFGADNIFSHTLQKVDGSLTRAGSV